MLINQMNAVAGKLNQAIGAKKPAPGAQGSSGEAVAKPTMQGDAFRSSGTTTRNAVGDAIKGAPKQDGGPKDDFGGKLAALKDKMAKAKAEKAEAGDKKEETKQEEASKKEEIEKEDVEKEEIEKEDAEKEEIEKEAGKDLGDKDFTRMKKKLEAEEAA